MEDYTTGNGLWNGWAWRLVGLTVLIVSALEVAAKLTIHYAIVQSLTLGVLIVSYWVIPRIHERKLGNAIAGVVATVIVGFVLQVVLHEQNMPIAKGGKMIGMTEIVKLDATSLVLGIIMAYLYLRLTNWSQRKRAELEAKRGQKNANNTQTDSTQVRRHSAKKKKRKKR